MIQELRKCIYIFYYIIRRSNKVRPAWVTPPSSRDSESKISIGESFEFTESRNKKERVMFPPPSQKNFNEFECIIGNMYKIYNYFYYK